MYKSPITIFAFLASVLLVSVSGQAFAQQNTLFDRLVVKVIEQVDIPAIEMGLIESLDVREGDRVKAGQTIAKLDDRQVQLQSKLAKAELAIAMQQSEQYFGIDLAERELAQQQQLAEQHKLKRDIAYQQAKNDFKILASKKGEAVAKNEYQRASSARAKFSDSVSKSELDALKLTVEKAQLETKQATFNQTIDSLTAKVEDKTLGLFALKVDSARISLKQAKSDKNVITLQTDAKKYAASMADLLIERHKIVSSLNGVVAERYCSKGTWVKPGDPIVRVIRLDRLQAEGFVSLETAKILRANNQVTVTVLATIGESEKRRAAEVVFVSPEINPVDAKVRVLVEFENPGEEILPGTHVSLTTDAK